MKQPYVKSLTIVREHDEEPDLSYLGEYGSEPREGAIDRQERGDMGERTLRYFYPGSDYPELDYNRMEAYNRGQWMLLDISVSACVIVELGGSVQQTVTFRSTGLHGIESDSEDGYILEVAEEQKVELRGLLERFNVDLSNWATLDLEVQA